MIMTGSKKLLRYRAKFHSWYVDGKMTTMGHAGYMPAIVSVFLSYDHPLFTTSGEIISQITAFLTFLLIFVFLPIVNVWSLG